MTIVPATRTAVITAINALHTATVLPDPVRRDALVLAIIAVGGATIQALTPGQIEAELDHIISNQSKVTRAPYTYKGYTRTALLAAIA